MAVFWDFSRLRIALSPDTNMADEYYASGGSAAHEFEVRAGIPVKCKPDL